MKCGAFRDAPTLKILGYFGTLHTQKPAKCSVCITLIFGAAIAPRCLAIFGGVACVTLMRLRGFTMGVTQRFS